MTAISIIIPFHNRSEYIEKLFRSLSNIRMPNVEIVFVDNNSNSETAALVKQQCRELSDKTTLKLSVVKEPRVGASAARNTGLRTARGEYVCFFDSDDEFSPELLDKAYCKAKEEDYDIVAYQTKIVFQNGMTRIKRTWCSSDPTHQIVCNIIATQSLFIKRSFALANALWDETLYYWNDLEWGLRILLAKPKIAWLKGCYHRIHIHSDSITGLFFSKRTDKIIYAHSVIHSDILRFADKKSSVRLLKALNYRIAIYAGYVYKEGSKEDSLHILSGIDMSLANIMHRIKISLLYFLARKGMPSLWRIALLWL